MVGTGLEYFLRDTEGVDPSRALTTLFEPADPEPPECWVSQPLYLSAPLFPSLGHQQMSQWGGSAQDQREKVGRAGRARRQKQVSRRNRMERHKAMTRGAVQIIGFLDRLNFIFHDVHPGTY